MKQRIEIVRGSTYDFEITAVDSSGAPYNLGSGEKIVFGIKKKPEREERPIFAKTAEIVGEGLFKVVIDVEDTQDLEPGVYYYDVGLEKGEKFFKVINPSPITIIANVTSRGCTE